MDQFSTKNLQRYLKCQYTVNVSFMFASVICVIFLLNNTYFVNGKGFSFRVHVCKISFKCFCVIN